MQCGQLAPAIAFPTTMASHISGPRKGAHQYLGDTQVSFVKAGGSLSLKKAAAWGGWVLCPGFPHPLSSNVVFSCSGVWASPGTWKQPPQRQIHQWGWVGMGGILFLTFAEQKEAHDLSGKTLLIVLPTLPFSELKDMPSGTSACPVTASGSPVASQPALSQYG